ncbi:MAG: OsmC family protein [Chloroflexota bacterium]|nr:MAG: OsmC family protein [Chloroflexota bacterium]
MAETMNVQATYSVGQSFNIATGTGHTVTLDGEHHSGASPMELLLASLAGCSGISIISILQKKQEDVTHYEIHVQGVRAAVHPLVFVEITAEHIITGHHIRPQSVERAIELAETRYCGVSIMLGKATQLKHIYRINEAE